MSCSNAAKTRNPLKCAGVPQTRQQISAASGPKFTILSVHVEEVLLFKKLFPIVDTCLICEDIAVESKGGFYGIDKTKCGYYGIDKSKCGYLSLIHI